MVLVVSALLGIILPQGALGACGYESVSVSGTAEEVEDGCRALEEVLSYFRGMGFKLTPELSIVFQEHVEIDMFLQDYGLRTDQPASQSEVSGYFNFRRKELLITSGRREVRRERTPWGIEWGQPIAYSILQHEVGHAVAANLLGNGYQRLGKAWHEFIAYSIQFDLMDHDLRRRVLANYPDAEPFRYPESINAIVHAADPDAFGVSAYLFAEANGGQALIRKVLTGDVPFSTEEFEFLWVK